MDGSGGYQGFLFASLGSPFSCFGCIPMQALSHGGKAQNLLPQLGNLCHCTDSRIMARYVAWPSLNQSLGSGGGVMY